MSDRAARRRRRSVAALLLLAAAPATGIAQDVSLDACDCVRLLSGAPPERSDSVHSSSGDVVPAVSMPSAPERPGSGLLALGLTALAGVTVQVLYPRGAGTPVEAGS